jgi:hypothetical protein
LSGSFGFICGIDFTSCTASRASRFTASPGLLATGAAHIAIRFKDSAIVSGSDRALTFGRRRSFIIAPPPTRHMFGLHTACVSGAGEFTAAPGIKGGITTKSYLWLSAIDVLAPAGVSLIAGFGDSITDGDQSTPDANSMWPAVLQ